MKLLNFSINLQYSITEPPVYKGEFSTVYRAWDNKLKRTVGIKEVDSSGFSNREKKEFLNEIPVWCEYAVRTMRVPQIFNVVEEKNRYYIIMQWIEGSTLRSYIDENKLSFIQKLDYAIQLCEALAPLHKKQMQHRDIKPENLQIAKDGRLYLLDFNTSAALPHVGLGTTGYLPPEQEGTSNKTGASRVDVFSIGVVLYELFSRCMPLYGINYYEDPQGTKWEYFQKPSEINSEIPEKLDMIIEKCMSFQRTDRYNNASEILGELKAIAYKHKQKGRHK